MDCRKVLVFHRGATPAPIVCENGDRYDSTARMFAGYNLLYLSDYWNTDHTEGYKGGRLAKGAYHGIVGPRAKDGLNVIKLFLCPAETFEKIETDAYLTDEMLTLPSEIPNPNHGGKHEIKYVQIHRGGMKWDWSHGCITGLNVGKHNEFDTLMGHLKLHEKLNVFLL